MSYDYFCMATVTKKAIVNGRKNHSNLRNRGSRLFAITAIHPLRPARKAAQRQKRHSGRASNKVRVRGGHGEGIRSGGHGENEYGRGDVFFVNRDSHFSSCRCSAHPTRAPQTKPAGPPSEPNMGLRRFRDVRGRVGRRGKRGRRRGAGEPGGVLASPPFVGTHTT